MGPKIQNSVPNNPQPIPTLGHSTSLTTIFTLTAPLNLRLSNKTLHTSSISCSYSHTGWFHPSDIWHGLKIQTLVTTRPNAVPQTVSTAITSADTTKTQYRFNGWTVSPNSTTRQSLRTDLQGSTRGEWGRDPDHGVRQVCFVFQTSRLFWPGVVILFSSPTAKVKDSRRPARLPDGSHPTHNSLIYRPTELKKCHKSVTQTQSARPLIKIDIKDFEITIYVCGVETPLCRRQLGLKVLQRICNSSSQPMQMCAE